MKRFSRTVVEHLKAGRELVLASVVAHTGSTPRSSGANMAVLADGSIFGSVGGGPLEAEVMDLAPGLFERGGASLYHYSLDGRRAADLGMACGGDVTVFALHVRPDEAALYADLAGALENGEDRLLLTEAAGPDEALSVATRRLIRLDDPECAGLRPGRAPALARDVESLRLLEPCLSPHTLHIVGAGHVSLHTARLADSAGFRVTVMDDREEFANRERFPAAHAVTVLPSFDACFNGGLGPRDFVLIVTRGHLHDKIVLGQALDTEAGYLGMIGSKKKKAATYAALRREGVLNAALERVYCPVGLTIGAETPEEIAVSIVAELIMVRAGLGKNADAA